KEAVVDVTVREWNDLEPRDRRRLRRMVRLGRPLEPQETELARTFARFQAGRMWNRLFWFWFVPGVVLALAIAIQLHPIVIGVVIALSAQALLAHRNLARLARE